MEFDGPKGESYIIEEKISDYAFKVKDRNGKISVLMYPKDNIIIFPDNARTIYDTYKKEWEFLNGKKIKKNHTHTSSNKNTTTCEQKVFQKKISVGDVVTIINKENNKSWKIKIVKANISYKPTLGSGSYKNSIYYKTNVEEFSNLENSEISEKAPIAKALLGKKENDSFSYNTPDGETVSGKIIKI